MSPRLVNLLLSAGCITIISSSILKIMHLPYANILMIVAIILGVVGSSLHVVNLKKRIKELEQELASRK